MDKKIDMDSCEWLILDIKAGQSFTSTRPFKCPTCGWKSDRWFMSAEPHLMCPNEHYPGISKFSF